MKICVIGDGAWGTALAINALENKHDVVIWGAFPEYLDEIRTKRENRRFLPGVRLPDELQFEYDIKKAISGSRIIICAIPTQFLRNVLKKMIGNIPPGVIIVNVAKGIELDSW